jgi:hypothetical protein
MQQLITIWWGALQTMEFQVLLWKPHSRTFICKIFFAINDYLFVSGGRIEA